jgi:hypothetical protein
MSPGISGVVSVAYCPAPHLSSCQRREFVLRRDSTFLHPSGIGGAMEGLFVV